VYIYRYTYIRTYICILCHICDKPDNICILENPRQNPRNLGASDCSAWVSSCCSWVSCLFCGLLSPELNKGNARWQSVQVLKWLSCPCKNLHKSPCDPGPCEVPKQSEKSKTSTLKLQSHRVRLFRKVLLMASTIIHSLPARTSWTQRDEIVWLAGTQQYHAISGNTQWGNWNDCFWEVPQWAWHALVSQI